MPRRSIPLIPLGGLPLTLVSCAEPGWVGTWAVVEALREGVDVTTSYVGSGPANRTGCAAQRKSGLTLLEWYAGFEWSSYALLCPPGLSFYYGSYEETSAEYFGVEAEAGGLRLLGEAQDQSCEVERSEIVCTDEDDILVLRFRRAEERG